MRSGAGGVRCHSTEGVAEERQGGGSRSGSGSGRQAGAGGIRGSPYNSSVHLGEQFEEEGNWVALSILQILEREDSVSGKVRAISFNSESGKMQQ